MGQYYLMSQLPSLDCIGDTAPLPITEQRLSELCSRFLGKRAWQAFKDLTLSPPRNPEKVGFSLIDNWNMGERQLRLALANLRSAKLKKSFDSGNETPSSQILQVARTAVDTDDPLSAERLLNRYRLDFLETLRPADPFSDDAVFYYGLKLKLISRMRQFDTDNGKSAYRNIYDSIINGERQEAIQ